MQDTRTAFSRALVSGTAAAVGAMLVASLAGKRDSGSYAAPINASTHALWGEDVAQRDDASLKYTGTGALINQGAGIFWAMIYEKLFGGRADGSAAPKSVLTPLVGAAAVSALAYVTDYHLMPKRLTPGYENRISPKSLAAVFAAIAVGLAASDLLRGAGRREYSTNALR